MANQVLGTTPNGEYQIVEIDPLIDGAPSPRFAAWIRATSQGFHGPDLDAEEVVARLENRMKDGRRFLAAYPLSPRPAHVDEYAVAATFSTFDGTVNLDGTLLDADLITSVTVRTAHRRKGLLSTLMRADLQRAADRGQPLALLTASEATIYRRFGFGPVSFNHAISVETRNGLPMRRPLTGSVHSVTPDVLFELSQTIFERFHAHTNGSVTRGNSYPLAVSGRISDESALERNKKVRAGVYYDADSHPAGYLSYEVVGDDWPVALKIVDLVAVTPDAYLALWHYAGTIDLTVKVTFSEAPSLDPLPFALEDSRQYQVTGREDLLWVRVLDVKAVLEAREYLCDGDFAIEVTDTLGHAAGTYQVSVSGGRAEVTVLGAQSTDAETGGTEFGDALPADAQELSPAVLLDAADLGVLVFGGVDPVTRSSGMDLRYVGGAAMNEDERQNFARLFRQNTEPYCLTHF